MSGSGQSVVPWGGGTRIDVGNIPSSYDVAIDLSGFTGQIEHEVGDMTVAANAGVTIETLNALLETEGQRLPFEVRDPTQATVGGSVASNAPGRRQSSTGGIRDWVIGMQIVLSDGTITKSGGRVVKNVQGYELHRLHTGAFGTLGIVSQVAFKLLPLPPEQQAVIMWVDDIQTAGDVGMGFVNGLFGPEAVSLISGPLATSTILAASELPPANQAICALFVRLGGGVRSIKRQVNEVVGAAGAASATGYAVLFDDSAKAARAHLEDAEANAQIVIRMNARTSGTLKASDEICANASKLGDEISTICDLGFGALTVLGSSDSYSDIAAISFVNSVVGMVSKYQSSYVIEKCPVAVKHQLDAFSDVGSSIDVMRRIKAQYDPTNTLNPGRFAGKI